MCKSGGYILQTLDCTYSCVLSFFILFIYLVNFLFFKHFYFQLYIYV